MDDFKNQIKQHYAEKSLSESQLDRLQSKKSSPVYKWAFVAAAVALFMYIQSPSISIEEKVIQEIAYNHNKNLDIEYSGSNIDSLQDQMKKLDFQMVASAKIDPNRYEILGSRYCSIQGRLAAQVKLRDRASGKILTLYQVDKGELAAEGGYGGVNVQVWSEKGLLLGLAGY